MKTMDFSETIAACDLKADRCRQLIEIMKVCESRSFLYHMYALCFTRPIYQVSVYRTIRPLVCCCYLLLSFCNVLALNHNCPKEIPNGTLEPNCGYATDWFCEFECNGGYSEAGKTHYGYQRHTFMEGTFKGVRNEPDKLLCVNGAWKTGYEHLGLDVSGVCVLHDGKLCHLPVTKCYGILRKVIEKQ